jgi:hypothetical protein
MNENELPNECMRLNRFEIALEVYAGGKTIAAKAELRPDRQLSGLAGDLNKRLKVSRNIWRRKLVSPFLIAGGLKFAFCNDPVDKEARNTIDQQRNDSQLRNNRRAAKRPNGRFAEDGKVFFEGAIGSFGSRTQSKKLAKALGSSWDFQNKAGMLSDRNVSGIA